MPPRGRPRPPQYTPHPNLPIDIPLEATEEVPAPRTSTPPPRQHVAPPNSNPFQFDLKVLEQPCAHVHLVFHIRHIVTLELRVRVHCVLVVVVLVLGRQLYILLTTHSFWRLVPLIPFLSALITVLIHYPFHGPRTDPNPSTN